MNPTITFIVFVVLSVALVVMIWLSSMGETVIPTPRRADWLAGVLIAAVTVGLALL